MINKINRLIDGGSDHKMVNEALGIKCMLLRMQTQSKNSELNRQCKKLGQVFFDNGCFDEYEYKKICRQMGLNLIRYSKDHNNYEVVVILNDSINAATKCLLQCLHINYKNMNRGEVILFDGIRGGFYLNCALGSFFDGYDEFIYHHD